jgi:hypothetical protein
MLQYGTFEFDYDFITNIVTVLRLYNFFSPIVNNLTIRFNHTDQPIKVDLSNKYSDVNVEIMPQPDFGPFVYTIYKQDSKYLNKLPKKIQGETYGINLSYIFTQESKNLDSSCCNLVFEHNNKIIFSMCKIKNTQTSTSKYLFCYCDEKFTSIETIDIIRQIIISHIE